MTFAAVNLLQGALLSRTVQLIRAQVGFRIDMVTARTMTTLGSLQDVRSVEGFWSLLAS